MKNVKLKLVGVSPILLHNGQTADPLNRFAKAMKQVSGKRNKTEADLMELARLEFLAGLYLNSDGQVVLPDFMVEAALINGAKKVKRGPDAKAGMFVDGDALLQYGEDLDGEALWDSERYVNKSKVRVGTSSVMRYRPMFREWSAEVTIAFSDEILNESDIVDFAQRAGQMVGLGDWRPKFGRFVVGRI